MDNGTEPLKTEIHQENEVEENGLQTELVKRWHPLQCFLPDSDERLALMMLNTPLPEDLSFFRLLWKKAAFKGVTDGAIDTLHDRFPDSVDQYLPDVISGDFDSASSTTLKKYKNMGCEVIPTPDQDATDFTKCLHIVLGRISQGKIKVGRLVAHVSCFGRFDHMMANVNTLYRAAAFTHLPLYLMDHQSVTCLLTPGRHEIKVDTGWEGDWCGLVPVGEPCSQVTTTGLKWNLNKHKMAFGTLISTSNTFDGSGMVSVETDKPLIWTMAIKEREWTE